MANKKREIRFSLSNEDNRAFGTYRIKYTNQGRKMVKRQKYTYFISAVAIATLFTVFHVDENLTKVMYALSLSLLLVGFFFAEKIVIRQQEKAIEAYANSADSVHAPENLVRFGENSFVTTAGDDVQEFSYSDIKLIDLTEEAIYVWMSDTMIMPLPLHAFADLKEMKEYYKFLKSKTSDEAAGMGENEE